MTQTIVSQRPLDVQAARALAAHWLDRLLNREQSDSESNGDRILELARLSRFAEAETDAEAARDECSFIRGFSEGVEAGFALAIAMVSDPLGDPAAAIREALELGTSGVTLAREAMAQDRLPLRGG